MSFQDISHWEKNGIFRREGIDSRRMRLLKRGEFPIDDELDLHGFTVEEAEKKLAAFLHCALANELRHVEIIFGRGYRSPGGVGILGPHARMWLANSPGVFGVCAGAGESRQRRRFAETESAGGYLI